jgi:hypothetical protein
MSEKAYSLNLNVITHEAFCAMYNLDKTFIGTVNYMGLYPFWLPACSAKWWLRDASNSQLRRVHAILLEQGVPVGSQLTLGCTTRDMVIAYGRAIEKVLRFPESSVVEPMLLDELEGE